MSRKQHGPVHNIQPPQLTLPTPADPYPITSIEAHATYAQQLWSGARLDAQSAEEVALEQLVVRGTSLQQTTLPLLQCTDCRFDTSDFASCTMEKAYFRRVEFIGCRLLGISIIDADLADVRFSRCNLRLARLWTSKARSLRFEHCALQEASFDGLNLTGAVFATCDLTGADFRNATLKGADLRGSTLARIQIHSKDIAGAIIDPAQAIELIQLFGVTVRTEDT